MIYRCTARDARSSRTHGHMPAIGSHRLHADMCAVLASLRQRLTPLSDFIQVEATSFEAKEEEASAVTLTK